MPIQPRPLSHEIEAAADVLLGLAHDAENLRSHGAVERLIDGLEAVEARLHRLARGARQPG